jgi:hypothetical protein
LYLFLLKVARLAQTWVIVLVLRSVQPVLALIQGRCLGARPNVVNIIASVHPLQSVTNAQADCILYLWSWGLIFRGGIIGDSNRCHGRDRDDEEWELEQSPDKEQTQSLYRRVRLYYWREQRSDVVMSPLFSRVPIRRWKSVSLSQPFI